MDRLLRRPGLAVSERSFALIVFALYLALTLWTAAHHEAWSDETDPWLLMRDGGLRPLLEQTGYGYRGTPVLWFLAIWPFAAEGAPFPAQQLLNLLFAGAATWLVLRSAPFPRWVRVLFAFSYFPAFEYAVIGRPYALLMLLMLAFAAAWRDRGTRPLSIAMLVALLANTTAHGLLIAAVAGLALAIEWLRGSETPVRRRVVAMVAMLAGGILSLIQLWPKAGGQIFFSPVNLDSLHFTIATAFFPEWRTGTSFVPAVVILGILVGAIFRRALPLLFLALSVLGLFAIFLFVWMGGARHAGILLILVVAALWMAKAEGPLRWEKPAMAALALALAASAVSTFNASLAETRFAFSGSREVAHFLSGRGLDRFEIAAHPPLQCESVLVYLPGKQFWYPARGERGSFVNWDRGFQEEQAVSLEEAAVAAERGLSAKRWLFLTNRELPEAVRPRFRLLFRSRQPIWAKWDESYYLYERMAAPAAR